MTAPAVQVLEQKLDAISAQIRECKEPHLRRNMLIQMRQMMAELDRVVFDSSRLQAAKSDQAK
jgi:hypothetical protein